MNSKGLPITFLLIDLMLKNMRNKNVGVDDMKKEKCLWIYLKVEKINRRFFYKESTSDFFLHFFKKSR